MMRSLVLAAALALAACASAPPTTADRLAAARQKHELLATEVAELPAGPVRDELQAELDFLERALTNLESETLQ